MASSRRSSYVTRKGTIYSQDPYPTNHLFFLTPHNRFRRACFAISSSRIFESLIMIVIAGNCVIMALNAPLANDDKSNLNIKLELLDKYLLGIYITEALLKIVSQGFILHQYSYLRTPWNILDFIVIITGILPYVGLGNSGPTKVIKAARVLRPLKIVSGVPSLQIVLSAILKSMGSLMEIFLLVGFVIIIYAIIGMSLFQGLFHQTCVFTSNNTIWKDGWLCGPNNSSGRHCPDNTVCIQSWLGPNDGITSFDNIFLGCITVFQCITGEGWTDIMYAIFQVFDEKRLFMWLYFYSLNILGSHFMLNLVCGVLSGQFSKEKERAANCEEFLRIRAEKALERAAEKYAGWIDEGEFVTAKALEENLKKQEQLDDCGEVIEPPLKGLKLFLAHNNVVRAKLKTIMLSNFVYWLVLLLVFLNSVSAMMQYYQEKKWITDLISITDNFFLGFFFVEMCLKFYALGPKMYFQSKFNTFDCVVVFASLINWLLSKFAATNLAASVLRQLRLMRLFKFTMHWNSLKNIIASVLASMASIISLVVLLLLFLLIFGLLGMQLFGGLMHHTDPRSNFDDFFNAVLTVFQIVTGEDWNNVMYDGINAYGGALNAKGVSVSLYFILIVCLGNFVVINVFLAIAVDNISLTADEIEDEAEENLYRENHIKEIHEKYSSSDIIVEEENEKDTYSDSFAIEEFDYYPRNDITAKPGENFLENLKNPARMLPKPYKPPILEVNTFFIFAPTNSIRKIAHEIISNPVFDNILLALIIINSLLLALEDMTDQEATINNILSYVDYVFTAIFTLEAVLKLINYGCVLHHGSYFRGVWNCVDMFVVTCSITSIILNMKIKNASPAVKTVVKVLRVLRVLRPLKVINKLPKLKVVFICMLFSLKNVIMVLVIILQLLLIFSIMGVQLFSGQFWYCSDPSKYTEMDCQGSFITFEKNNYNTPIEMERVWLLHIFNFENIAQALITLFTSSTGDGWYIHMQHGIDSTSDGRGPIKNNKIWVSIYFLMFVVIFSFFFINVFVGMIILTFQEQAAAESGFELDRNTKNSLIFAMKSKPMERFMPEDVKSLQYTAWSLIESYPWEVGITSLIVINIISLLIEYNNEPLRFNNIMNTVSIVFSFMFVFEFAVKFFALGWNYFKDFWNVFDMLIVLGGILDFVFKTYFPQAPFDPSILRLFRALRLIKLLRRSHSLRILLWTFLKSFRALPYVAMLIFLLFFVYAIIGMQIFSQIAINSSEDQWQYINEDNNFRTYFSSTQILFRISTGENWPKIMMACSYGAPCDYDMATVNDNSNQCGTYLTYVYFISFIFLCCFLMLNLFVAVIMDNFSFLTEDSSILGPHHLDEFVTVWSDFDPRASGRIQYTEVCELLRQMTPPLGLGRKCLKVVAYKRLVKMNMTLYKDGAVDYTGTFFALVRTALEVYTENANLKSNDLALRKMLKSEFPNISKRTLDLVIPRNPRDSKHMSIGKIFAAKLILENYRSVRRNGKRKKSAIDSVLVANET
ncbi:voltage-dependent P/Q-type calcium channel subunit alpha-1A isoform X2 [Hydra vulgaris]|uniref:voltage-dependent P/Q-type calcium channel subunit alpha-1A isoform X1 n=1 Tax=Hydra vulgaris TaxID=6087 RepID=UPI0032EA6105